ncbi:hypothetical protein BaRGS_00033335 [Batillaria attramentaria]|uniref:Uncharacterized protein n=1 Tax=Batillaria attramentaria TaxID=370345 RepID=A0ABD0JKP3_9CAEN
MQKLAQETTARWVVHETLITLLFVIFAMFVSSGHENTTRVYYSNKYIQNLMLGDASITSHADHVFIQTTSHADHVFIQTTSHADHVFIQTTSHADHVFIQITKREEILNFTRTSLLVTIGASKTLKTTQSMDHIMLGPARIRQTRDKPDTDRCPEIVTKRWPDLLPKTGVCLPSHSWFDFDTTTYNFNWSKPLKGNQQPSRGTGLTARYKAPEAWMHHTAAELNGVPLWGYWGLYEGGGYEMTLPTDISTSRGMLAELESQQWVDELTRGVFLDMNLYNPAGDLISFVTLMFELTQRGEVKTTIHCVTSKMDNLDKSPRSITLNVCMVGFIGLTLLNLFVELRNVVDQGLAEYITSPWNWLQVCVVITCVTGITFQVNRIVLMSLAKKALTNSHFITHTGMAKLQQMDIFYRAFRSINIAMVVLSLFRVIRFTPYFQVMAMTFHVAFYELANYSFVIFLILLTFTSFAHLQ